LGKELGETVVTYARDLPSGVNAHIGRNDEGISAGGWGITQEK